MKNSVKALSGIVLTFVVLGTLAILAIKYFDVLLRVVDSLKGNVFGKKTGLFSDECCDFGSCDEAEEAQEV